MIRTTKPEETDVLKEMARATAVFRPIEIDALGEVLDDFHNNASGDNHRTHL